MHIQYITSPAINYGYMKIWHTENVNMNSSLNYNYNELMYKFQKVNIPYTKCGLFNK